MKAGGQRQLAADRDHWLQCNECYSKCRRSQRCTCAYHKEAPQVVEERREWMKWPLGEPDDSQ